jgi:multiple sugar transport system substrate-binding protein
MKRNILTVGFVILTIALVVSVIGTPQMAVAKDITIRFSGWMIGEPYARELERSRWDEFEKQNPGIKIEGVLTPFMETMQQLMVARAAGTMPDVVMLTPKWVNSFAETGDFVDLHKYYSKEELADMPQAQYKQGVYNGKLLAVPLDLGTIVCLGWKPLLQKAGLPLKIPETYDEFKKAVAKISALSPDVYGFGARTFKNSNSGYWFFPPMWGHGGKFEDENGNVVFNNPGVVAALDWYKEAAAKKHIPLGVDVRESRMYWAKERVGFIFDGPWMRGVTRKLTGWGNKADDYYIIGPMPKGPDGTSRTINNSHVLSVSAQSKHPDIAAKFIRFLTQDPAMVEKLYKEYGGIPTYKKFLNEPWAQGDEYLKSFMEISEVADGAPSKDPNFIGALEIVAEAMQVAVNQGDTKKAAANAEKRIKKLYDQK